MSERLRSLARRSPKSPADRSLDDVKQKGGARRLDAPALEGAENEMRDPDPSTPALRSDSESSAWDSESSEDDSDWDADDTAEKPSKPTSKQQEYSTPLHALATDAARKQLMSSTSPLTPPALVEEEPSPQSSGRGSTRGEAVLAFAARSPPLAESSVDSEAPALAGLAGSPPTTDAAWPSAPLPPYQPPQTSTVQLVKGECAPTPTPTPLAGDGSVWAR